jgi:hypothetical protein
MKGKVKSSLANFPLTAYQALWIKTVYPHKGAISEKETVRALIGKIPIDFKIYDEMRHFWDGNRLKIFGLYKANPKDEILATLDLMLRALRDRFVMDKERDFVTLGEFSSVIPKRTAAIKRIFNSAYLNEFWIDQNLQERSGVDVNSGEPRYEFGGSTGMQHVMGYKDFESQIEFRWQKEIGVPGGVHSVLSPGEMLSAGLTDIFDDAISLVAGAPSPKRPAATLAAPQRKSKPEIISVSDDGLLATWKGKTYSVNDFQADILRACIVMWIEGGRKPLTGRIEQVRRRVRKDELPTVGRAFNKHALTALFKILKAKGTFQFKP